MKITSARFIKSSPALKDCPAGTLPEYAFIGRSNVGKSSLINMLVGRRSLALTSSRPGKTQLINHFLINESWYIADLPGYGYAKVSKEKRAGFDKMISQYILGRKNLECVFVLIDARHEPQKTDLDFLLNLGESGIPFCLVFTKCDKVTASVLPKNIAAYKKILTGYFTEFPQYFLTSSVTARGRAEVLDLVTECNTKSGKK